MCPEIHVNLDVTPLTEQEYKRKARKYPITVHYEIHYLNISLSATTTARIYPDHNDITILTGEKEQKGKA